MRRPVNPAAAAASRRRCPSQRQKIEESQLVGGRCSVEFEPEWLQLVRELYNMPVIQVGLFLPAPPPIQDLAHRSGGDVAVAGTAGAGLRPVHDVRKREEADRCAAANNSSRPGGFNASHLVENKVARNQDMDCSRPKILQLL
ncbi:hypothetical protein PR202_gb04104 [Eleusine coracana subsp. coracana]|uniref:Uncharacterized protein n=1 Tax=Eleusine coracana subsp. coracana TaxID=191504 RepID=A0AAV5E4I6_ELECO|nr:hypothetical protein PR202_gb04104 [Eleusine coracana subsp. coracana]